MAQKETPVIHADARKGEIRHSRASIEKARRVLGYNPQIGIEQGLRLLWEGGSNA
jgi:nucleoside-diphosphate-sugar epimerase